jgi:hypothetical protein
MTYIGFSSISGHIRTITLFAKVKVIASEKATWLVTDSVIHSCATARDLHTIPLFSTVDFGVALMIFYMSKILIC